VGYPAPSFAQAGQADSSPALEQWSALFARSYLHLLDAISAIEHATDVLTNHGERTPF
jgi:hypothetical protein